MKLPVPYFSFFYFKVFHFLNHRISFFKSQNKACVYQWGYSVFHHNMNMINCWKSKAYCCKKKIQKTSRKNWITISFIYIMYFITTYYFCICQKKKNYSRIKTFCTDNCWIYWKYPPPFLREGWCNSDCLPEWLISLQWGRRSVKCQGHTKTMLPSHVIDFH